MDGLGILHSCIVSDKLIYLIFGGTMHQDYFKRVIDLTIENIEQGGRPFGALVVQDGKVIAEAVNTMLVDHDPTAHAEMSAIRKAAKKLKTIDLTGSIIYASGEPCPMCQAALYMAGIREVYYLFSNADGASYQLSTQSIADEMMKLPQERTDMIFKQADSRTKDQFMNIYQLWAAQ